VGTFGEERFLRLALSPEQRHRRAGTGAYSLSVVLAVRFGPGLILDWRGAPLSAAAKPSFLVAPGERDVDAIEKATGGEISVVARLRHEGLSAPWHG
jgi:hypothetical protein